MVKNIKKNKPNLIKDYVIGTIPAVIGFIGGIIFTLGNTIGYIIGSALFVLTIISSIYVLKRFDSRPDIQKAKDDIAEYSNKLKTLSDNYKDMKHDAEQAKEVITNLRQNLESLSQEIINAKSKLDSVNVKANVNLFATGVKALKDLSDDN